MLSPYKIKRNISSFLLLPQGVDVCINIVMGLRYLCKKLQNEHIYLHVCVRVCQVTSVVPDSATGVSKTILQKFLFIGNKYAVHYLCCNHSTLWYHNKDKDFRK